LTTKVFYSARRNFYYWFTKRAEFTNVQFGWSKQHIFPSI